MMPKFSPGSDSKTALFPSAVLSLLLLLVACSPGSDATELKTAAVIHEELMALGLQLKDRLDSLAGSSPALRDSIPVWRSELAVLRNSMVEVPGHDHSHDDEDSHHHEPAPDLTSKQILELHVELRRRMQALQERIRTN